MITEIPIYDIFLTIPVVRLNLQSPKRSTVADSVTFVLGSQQDLNPIIQPVYYITLTGLQYISITSSDNPHRFLFLPERCLEPD